MKIVYYQHENEFVPGIATDKGVIPVNKYAREKYNDKPLTISDLAELAEIEQKAGRQSENLLRQESLLNAKFSEG